MRYLVSGEMMVNCFTIVEAESEGEAIEIAGGRLVADLPVVAFRGQPITNCWHFSNDGKPQDLRIDKE